MTDISDEYIQLCIDEMNAIAKASQDLITEAIEGNHYRPVYEGDDWNLDEHIRWQARRRAELYRKYLDEAGIEIRRKESENV